MYIFKRLLTNININQYTSSIPNRVYASRCYISVIACVNH